MKKKKQKQAALKGFFWVASIALVSVALLTILFILVNKNPSHDSSLTGQEAIESKQNTIPQDVETLLKEHKKVLGTQIGNFQQNSTLPKSLHVPILMFHYIEYVQDRGDKIRISLNTTPWTLEQEIKTLQNAGYTFMTNAELTSALDGKTQLPQKPIALTFDDGYRDFYTDAYPILKKYHVKATEYVIAGYPYFNTPNHLTTSQLIEIANDGLVEIGAHTVHHVWLKGQTQQTVTFEVAQSKKILEDTIHRQVISFAYPFGAFDLQAIHAVDVAGFTSATSTVPGIDQLPTNRFFLYRLRPGGRVGPDLLSWLTTVQNAN